MRKRKVSRRVSKILMLEIGKTIDRYHARHPALSVGLVIRTLKSLTGHLVRTAAKHA